MTILKTLLTAITTAAGTAVLATQAHAAPALPALVIELNSKFFSPNRMLYKLSLTSEFINKLETQKVDCAILTPARSEFLYFQLSKQQVTWRGPAYTADIMQSAEDVREDAPRAVQTAAYARDIAVKLSGRQFAMSVTSNTLTPTTIDDSTIPEASFVSIGEFEGLPRGKLLCAYYPLPQL